MTDTPPDRREVLRLAAASMALAAAACDAGPDEFGHPLHGAAEGASEAATFATALELGGLGRGVLVRRRGGHAVKLEGNPDHPASLGATDIFAEAAVLSLHDPARSRRVREDGRPRPPAAVDAALASARAALLPRGGAGLLLVTGPIASPTTARLMQAVLEAFPAARWQQHDALADDAALAGAVQAFGQPIATLPDLARARLVLALGADPLGPGPAQQRLARDWSRARAAGRDRGDLPTLLVAEATPTLTGARADRRLAMRDVEPFARAIATALGVPSLGAPATHPEAASVAEALRRAGGEAAVLAGASQPVSVHALAHAINAALGSTVVRHIALPLARPATMGDAALAAALAEGEVTHLLMLGVNPAGTAPMQRDAMARQPFSLHLGAYVDETAHLCRWHLPLAHELEGWGDTRAFDGTAAIRQPATTPLVPEARGLDDVLAALLGLAERGEALVRATWRGEWGEAGFEPRWRAALDAGVVEGTQAPALSPSLRPDWDRGTSPPPAAGLHALFAPDPHLLDGRFAENAWLQELPRPLTKTAWGNAVLVAPADAAELGLSAGDEVVVELGARSVLAPVLPLAAQALGCVTLPLGGGRRAGGDVGTARGFDAATLRDPTTPWAAGPVTLRPTGKRAEIIATQTGMPAEAPPVLAPGQAIPPRPPSASLYPEWKYEGQAWGMAIDLDACIGCNACAIACQAENNTPVVGPQEVARGREMHWLRIDLHQADDHTIFQPVPCMHCEKAPCEVVCPVNATVHDDEGLNLMVYPRCIGTRTCSNNCPYKVRRFNWFDYARSEGGLAVRNPDVPVRPRGVIEKCTYCQHRIAAARTEARLEGRPVRDGEVETACQRACPTRAITFGDVNDPASAVAQAKREGRNYALLGELDTRPRTTYLARVAPPEEGPAG
jgi:Fe-S-cluster-containing dehydrogenase component/anaerobic selenocysteine-containing dehydrogenase